MSDLIWSTTITTQPQPSVMTIEQAKVNVSVLEAAIEQIRIRDDEIRRLQAKLKIYEKGNQ